MTTMDSDSESQDSDDGRRFRFEATRKDNSHLDSKMRSKSSRLNSKHKSHYDDIDYEERKDRSRHETGRKEHSSTSKDRDSEGKDLRYSTKYSKHKHESRSSRHEDSHRDPSLASKTCGTTVSKQKTRDSKHHRRDRSIEHRKHRSQERSHTRNNEDDRSSTDRHKGSKSKLHEKYKRHSRDRSRDRDYQSRKMKPAEYGRSRGHVSLDHERQNSHKKARVDEKSFNLRDEASPSKRDLSVGSQECKDLDLSEFDVLSETDENLSDNSDIKSQSSIPRQHKTKTKKRNSSVENENTTKKQANESEQHLERYQKVNAKRSDPMYGSSDNNSTAVSDSLLGTASSISSALTVDRINDANKRLKCVSNEETVDCDSKAESSNHSVEDTCLHFDSHDSPRNSRGSKECTSGSLASHTETTDSAYGPALPPIVTSSNITQKAKSPSSSEEMEGLPENHIKSKKGFIGPCLPGNITKTVVDETVCQDSMEVDSDSSKDGDFMFGPALPPHLMQQCSRLDAETEAETENDAKVIGPALPGDRSSPDNLQTETRQSEQSEEEDGIGPLPADHPALKSSYVYKLLEHRAQALKDEQKEEDESILKQREEWMTELPPAQTSNLGLGPRKFRIRAGPDMSDRSCWTDTPAKKAEKQRKREQEKLYNCNAKPDAEPVSESCEPESGRSRKREKTLLELHQSKLRKKKKKDEKEAKLTGETIRRPFDRTIDLKVNRFDQTQKNTILRKAQFLDDRFSRGKI